MEDYLHDYTLVVDERGFVMMEGDMVKLQNIATGILMKADYEKVAGYFNLTTVDESSNQKNDVAPPTGFYDEEESFSTLDQEKEGESPYDQETEKPGTRNPVKWTEGQTKFLLNWYGENFNNVGPLKKFRLKRNMWEHLAEELYKQFDLKVTPLQVETRYKCVLKRRKLAIDNNDTSGRKYKEIEYEDEINQIVAQDDSLLPEFLASPGIYTKKVGSVHKTYNKAIPSNSITPSTTTNPPSIELVQNKFKKPTPSRPIAPPTTTNLPSTSRNSTFKAYPPSTSTHLSSSTPILPSNFKFSPIRPNPPTTSNISDVPSLPEVPEPSNNSQSLSSETDSENFTGFSSETSPTPKKRVRKTVQEKFCEQFFEYKKAQNKRKEHMYLEAQENKKQRHKEKEENKAKRHAEKLQRLDRWIERQQN